MNVHKSCILIKWNFRLLLTCCKCFQRHLTTALLPITTWVSELIAFEFSCGKKGYKKRSITERKNTIRDGGSTTLWAVYTVDTVDTVQTVHTDDTVYTLYTVDTVDIVYTIQNALHCLNSSMFASKSATNCCQHDPHHQHRQQKQNQQDLSWHLHTPRSH